MDCWETFFTRYNGPDNEWNSSEIIYIFELTI